MMLSLINHFQSKHNLIQLPFKDFQASHPLHSSAQIVPVQPSRLDNRPFFASRPILSVLALLYAIHQRDYLLYYSMYRVLRSVSSFSTGKFQEYLNIMQVNSSTTQQQLKTRFIQLAKKYHPDSGSVKDPTKFKSILEAYRYLSVQSNWPQTKTNQQQSTTHSQRVETKEQKDRRQTYSYFNAKQRGFRGVDNTGSMGYDSFFQTLKAAPELKVFTLGLIGLGVMIWFFMATGMSRRSGPNRVQVQKIFYSKQQQQEYREKQRRRKRKNQQYLKDSEREYYRSFNFGQRFNRKGPDAQDCAPAS